MISKHSAHVSVSCGAPNLWSADACWGQSNKFFGFRPALCLAESACQLTAASGHQTIALLIDVPGLRVVRYMSLLTKQWACSSPRQDWVSIDRRLWSPNNRPAQRCARTVSVDRRFWWPRNGPAHRLDKTGRRLTDASGHQTIGMLIGAPGLRAD